MPIDEPKLNALVGKMIGDLGAAAGAALVVVGDKLGLYRAIAEAGPVTPVELATRTATAERYVREWLAQQAAAGYVEYDAAAGRYSMTPEQQLAFAVEGSPACVLGASPINRTATRGAPACASMCASDSLRLVTSRLLSTRPWMDGLSS